MASTKDAPTLEQTTQRQETHILGRLNTLVASGHTTDAECRHLLEELHGLTKSAHGQRLASSLTVSNIAVLGHLGFERSCIDSRHSSLRCLNNVMIQAPQAIKMFADAGLIGKAIALLKSTYSENEFLAARLLLLCSAQAAGDILPHLEDGGLAEAINANMTRHATMPNVELSQACEANLQLISVLAAKEAAQAHRFFESLAPILEILDRLPIPSPPLEPPMSLLIDCLTVLSFSEETYLPPGNGWPPFDDDKLIHVLDLAIQAYRREDLESRSTPLITLLFFMARDAPESSKQRLRCHLLPSDEDRKEVLGRGDSLPHRLVRISIEAVDQTFKKALAHLLFELCTGDPKVLVDNVGFGCGVGMLHVLGISPPSGGTDDVVSAARLSNHDPVTGQRRDTESQSMISGMTSEEKIREAERLFVLFERLNATGVMNVENPVRAAAASGRIQELESDTSDD